MTAPKPRARDERDDELRELLEAAGPRPEVPETAMRSIRAAARAEWLRLPKRRSTSIPARRWLPALLAATLLVALALGWEFRGERSEAPAPVEAVAVIELRRGDVEVVPAPPESAALRAGARIATAAGEPAARAALRMTGGGSLRLDRGTSVRLASATRIELERGAVYFDSRGAGGGGEPIEIATPFGVVHELGTQFEVRLGAGRGSELAVRVREGSVALALGSGAQTVVAGERLVASAAGELERGASERHGTAWDWILESAPVPDFGGRSLRVVLDWGCRELGWELRFADAGLEREAESIRLHGAVEGLRPDQVVEASLTGAGLGHRLEEGVLTVTRLAPAPGG